MGLHTFSDTTTNAQLLMNKHYTIEITEQYHCVEQKTADI